MGGKTRKEKGRVDETFTTGRREKILLDSIQVNEESIIPGGREERLKKMSQSPPGMATEKHLTMVSKNVSERSSTLTRGMTSRQRLASE